ncbi:hypothetical protein B484DRAFT_288300 [Ochromonadaceae sp. CCMP2298]|nr:hypothetical protein B484DRAFT_288300 [Ochromonadaceae sp. CCMP2298]
MSSATAFDPLCGKCFRPIQAGTGGFILSCSDFICIKCINLTPSRCPACGKSGVNSLNLSDPLPEEVQSSISDPGKELKTMTNTLLFQVKYYKSTVKKMLSRLVKVENENVSFRRYSTISRHGYDDTPNFPSPFSTESCRSTSKEVLVCSQSRGFLMLTSSSSKVIHTSMQYSTQLLLPSAIHHTSYTSCYILLRGQCISRCRRFRRSDLAIPRSPSPTLPLGSQARPAPPPRNRARERVGRARVRPTRTRRCARPLRCREANMARACWASGSRAPARYDPIGSSTYHIQARLCTPLTFILSMSPVPHYPQTYHGAGQDSTPKRSYSEPRQDIEWGFGGGGNGSSGSGAPSVTPLASARPSSSYAGGPGGFQQEYSRPPSSGGRPTSSGGRPQSSGRGSAQSQYAPRSSQQQQQPQQQHFQQRQSTPSMPRPYTTGTSPNERQQGPISSHVRATTAHCRTRLPSTPDSLYNTPSPSPSPSPPPHLLLLNRFSFCLPLCPAALPAAALSSAQPAPARGPRQRRQQRPVPLRTPPDGRGRLAQPAR